MRLKNLSILSFPRKRESKTLDPHVRGGDRFFRRCLAAILLAIFTLNQTVPVHASLLPAEFSPASSFLNNIRIPETLGRVEEVYQVKTDELVIYMAGLSATGQGNFMSFLGKLISAIAKRKQAVFILSLKCRFCFINPLFQSVIETLKQITDGSGVIFADKLLKFP